MWPVGRPSLFMENMPLMARDVKPANEKGFSLVASSLNNRISFFLSLSSHLAFSLLLG